MRKLKFRWRKVAKRLYCLHVNNGHNEVAFYASWYPSQHRSLPGFWLMFHLNGIVGSQNGAAKMKSTTKSHLELAATEYLQRQPDAWESAKQTGPGCIVWCPATTRPIRELKLSTVMLHDRGLELVQIYGDGKQHQLVCRMR